VAGAFEERLPDAVAATPEIVAHHLTEAGLGDRAVVYWLRAGRQAAERSALAEAVAHLARGLDALALAPAGVERDRAELDLQVALGTHLMPLRGWSAPEVERAWTRARELCGRTGDESHLHRVLWGQSVVQHNRPELQAALQTAAELLRHGEERDDLRAATMGHRQLGNTLTHLARFAEARRHLEQAAELGIRAGPTAFADHVYDPVVASRAYLARCLLHTGHPDQQERMIARTLAEAERSGHMPGLAFVLFQAAELGVERRDPRAARTNLGRLIPLAREQGFVLWLAMAGAIDGWIMAEEGEHAGACAKIQDGLATYEAQGVRLVRPFLLAMLGAALGRVGRPDEALAALDAGLALAAEKGEVIWEPELHRLKGGMLLASSSDSKAEAENSYARAIEVARGQEARLAELRAATSLARVWAEGGERRRARDLLAPVHAWFTEGFKTPDLKAATALVGALA
jgi:predicted ATPase